MNEPTLAQRMEEALDDLAFPTAPGEIAECLERVLDEVPEQIADYLHTPWVLSRADIQFGVREVLGLSVQGVAPTARRAGPSESKVAPSCDKSSRPPELAARDDARVWATDKHGNVSHLMPEGTPVPRKEVMPSAGVANDDSLPGSATEATAHRPEPELDQCHTEGCTLWRSHPGECKRPEPEELPEWWTRELRIYLNDYMPAMASPIEAALREREELRERNAFQREDRGRLAIKCDDLERERDDLRAAARGFAAIIAQNEHQMFTQSDWECWQEDAEQFLDANP